MYKCFNVLSLCTEKTKQFVIFRYIDKMLSLLFEKVSENVNFLYGKDILVLIAFLSGHLYWFTINTYITVIYEMRATFHIIPDRRPFECFHQSNIVYTNHTDMRRETGCYLII